MSFVSFIKKNKFFTVITALFLTWVIILVISAIINYRIITFYDYGFTDSDVSSQYQSIIPLSRYLIEPFTGIAYFFGNYYTCIVLFIILYIIFRISYLAAKKMGFFRSQKYKTIKYIVDDLIVFSFKIAAPLFMMIGIPLGLSYATTGLIFVNLYWRMALNVGMAIFFVLFFIKVLYVLAMILNKGIELKYLEKKRNQPIERSKRGYRYYRFTKKEFVYMMTVVFFVANTNFLMISIPFPTQSIQTDLASDEFLFDFHVHTTFSDGSLTPQQRISWYIEQGISGAAFSDHDNLRGSVAARTIVQQMGLDFIVYTAQEWTDHENDIHMNIYGIDENIVPLESYVTGGPLAMNASDTIQYVKLKGGYIIVNHYNDKPYPEGGFGMPYSYQNLTDWGVDGFEIINGGNQKSTKIRDWCETQGLAWMGGSDIHTNEPLNTLVRMTLKDPSNTSIDNIFATLKNNTHQVVSFPQFPEVFDLPSSLNNIGIKFIENILNYFSNIDSFQVLSWLIWSSIAYGVFYGIYRKIKKVDIYILKEKTL